MGEVGGERGVFWIGIAKRIARNHFQHRTPGWAAEMSFYFFLSVFPVLLAGMTVLGLFLDAQWLVRETIVNRLAQFAPSAAVGLLDRLLDHLARQPARPLGFGIVIALWAASSGMATTIRALNQAYRVGEERSWWRRRLVAIALTLVFMMLTVTAMILVAYGIPIADVVADRLGLGAAFVVAWRIAQWPVIFGVLLLAFHLLYRYAPHHARPHRRWWQTGTLVGIGLWLLVSLGFKYYVANLGRYDLAYGSLGAVIVVLLWFYLMSIAVLTGAEINAEIESCDRRSVET